VLDDEQRVALCDEALEDEEELGDVVEMQAGGGLVEDEKRVRGGLRLGRARLGGGIGSGGIDETLDELEALALAAAEDIERLAEAEVAEADFGEDAQGA